MLELGARSNWVREGNMASFGWRDLATILVLGVIGLLLFHLDHLLVSYSGWDDPAWLLHLVVDGSYVLLYGTLGWLVLRGWHLWRRASKKENL